MQQNGVQGVFGTPEWEETDFATAKRLREASILFMVPSGEHDDLYMLDYAWRKDGFIVSNDQVSVIC